MDGFRFDLAPALARATRGESVRRFFDVVRQDPDISRVKLIAEPWDLGPDGYQVGRFPIGWGEWKASTVTHAAVLAGRGGQVGELASRLAGSSDSSKRASAVPQASINFVTCHDGFTLHDLVSYEHKHNEANGEDNRDGTDNNQSRNWGAEGPSEAVHVVRMRERIKRNLLATLAFSQGVPMLSHGDELGRTQRGNNNAYCQDGPLTWIDWRLTPLQRELLEFTRAAFAIRAANPVLRRRSYFRHERTSRAAPRTSPGFGPTVSEMTEEQWADGSNHVLGMLILGEATDEIDERGRTAAGRGDPAADQRRRPLAGPSPCRSLETPGGWTEILNTSHPAPRTVRQGKVSWRPTR